ncbi:MAG TPA: protein kinase [Actinophytocola sp.]|uniref:serine/threonine protein kinase n=1 Tax=Actinophytocola sp. TaxID=1872138 RepID=UPI002F92A5DF
MHHTDWTTTGTLGDRYVLRTRVGSGRTTTVYSADDVRLEREVAVKAFHTVPDQDGLARFANEAQVLGGLSHPGLVTVYDVNLDAQTPYMVMRLIDGGPLSDLVQPEGLEPRAVARLGAQLAEVLAYVHERGVVHGDVDAHNVLIDADGDGHLTGFGADYGLGTVSGDVYSLGMLLAECLPFGLGGEWRVVLAAMTDPDPDARPTADRAAEMLRNILAGDTAEFPLPLPRSEEDAVEPSLPGRETKERKEPGTARHIRPAYAGLTGMGLAISALAVVLATTGTEQPARPSGEQPPQVVQPTDRNAPQPPGQSYPQAPGQRQAAPPESSSSAKNRSKPARPPQSSQPSQPTAPPQQGDGSDQRDPGNGRGHGNGHDREDGGLLGGLLGL